MKGFSCCILLVAAAAGAVAVPSHERLLKTNQTRSAVRDDCNICNIESCEYCTGVPWGACTPEPCVCTQGPECPTVEPCPPEEAHTTPEPCVYTQGPECPTVEPCPPEEAHTTPEPCVYTQGPECPTVEACPPVEDCPTYEPPQCPTYAPSTCPPVEECPTIPAITCPPIPDCPTNPPPTTIYPGTCPPTQLNPPRFSKSIYQAYLSTWPTAGTTVHLGINATIGGNLPLVYQLVTSFEILALSASHDIIFTNNISEGAYVGPNNVMILEVTATAMWDESLTSSAAIALVFPRGSREASHQTNTGLKNI